VLLLWTLRVRVKVRVRVRAWVNRVNNRGPIWIWELNQAVRGFSRWPERARKFQDNLDKT
jgi:hypothetical protein